ncbi:MAG: aspartate dehydrogenase [Alphaproteobacteria bacterium]|nr:aspartate dehydrogenase [Alphaproteobacteria bacterium]
MDVLLIGLGGIGRVVVRHLGQADAAQRVRWVLVRQARCDAVAAELGSEIRVISGIDELGDADRPDLAVECAGHGAVADYGPALLERGIDLLVISVGALTDAALHDRLIDNARRGGARLLLPAGAIAGIDAIAAARRAGLTRVTYVSRKPPKAWRGTAAEAVTDLGTIDKATVLFEGPAGEAARRYPQNANVAATVALAGLGLERTAARLIADPAAPGNVHEVEAEGAFGQLSIRLMGKPLPDNPKTSTLTAYSVLRAIENRVATVEI